MEHKEKPLAPLLDRRTVGKRARETGGLSNQKAGLALARQAFIYGEGDGEPVLGIDRLIELSNLSAVTIKKYLGVWTDEREKMLIENGNCRLVMHLSGKTIRDHHADVEFLRVQADALKVEVENVDKASQNLFSVLSDLADSIDFGPDDAETLITLAEKYFELTGSKKSLLATVLAVTKRWQESSGIASTMKAWEAGQREQEKGLARIESKKKEIELLKDGTLEVISTPALGVFARKKEPAGK